MLAHDGPNQVLFHQLFMNYKTPTFALCGSIGLSVAKLVEARFGFGFARYPSPLPNVFFFHGEGTLVELIKATIDAEITTEGYVHVGAAVKGGYPTADPWIGWDLGLDFEYFRQQFNAQAWAKISIIPLDFTAGAELLASNKGIVGCLTFDTVFGDWHPGGGAKWGHGPKLYLFGCDVDDYKVVIRNALSGDLRHRAAAARREGRRRARAPASGRSRPAAAATTRRSSATPGPSLAKAHAAQAGGAAGRDRHPGGPARHRDGLQGRRRRAAPRPPRPEGRDDRHRRRQRADADAGRRRAQEPDDGHHRGRRRQAVGRALDGRGRAGLGPPRRGDPGQRHRARQDHRQGRRPRPGPHVVLQR